MKLLRIMLVILAMVILTPFESRHSYDCWNRQRNGRLLESCELRRSCSLLGRARLARARGGTTRGRLRSYRRSATLPIHV
jgi:hypothetical protein